MVRKGCFTVSRFVTSGGILVVDGSRETRTDPILLDAFVSLFLVSVVSRYLSCPPGLDCI